MTAKRPRATGALLLLSTLPLTAGCGGSPSSPGIMGPQPASYTFGGTTRATGPGSCTGDSHPFEAPEGQIAITLVQTTPAESLTVQVCPNSTTYAQTDCTVTRRVINVGQTIAEPRRGGSAQSLSLLPLTCGTNAPPSPHPIAYTAMVRTGVS